MCEFAAEEELKEKEAKEECYACKDKPCNREWCPFTEVKND